MIFYPRNFPKHLEKPLISLLSLIEKDFEKTVPKNEKQFNRLILNHLKEKTIHVFFKDIKPSLWWLRFILLRYTDSFEHDFIQTIMPFLVKTKTRSLSGIVPLSLFTKGTGCPFTCAYCPNEPGVPKSYFSDEPAVMRAIRHNFDPYTQTKQRLIMFALSGHPIDKVEIIVKGGTFSFYPKSYRTWFMKRVFDACNVDIMSLLQTGKETKKTSRTLDDAQKINETALSRVIGINIETRPDFITKKEILFLRKLGVTHVEIGVQLPDDDVYKLIQRGHTVQDVIDATKLLKNAGFKVGYHLMPNLPGSTQEKDTFLFTSIFTNDDYKPDHLKLYPTTITPHTLISQWFAEKKYIPYSLDILTKLIIYLKSEVIPLWVRIGRLTRDITTTMMEQKQFAPNLRELIQRQMEEKKVYCSCIRCREIKNNKIVGTPLLNKSIYTASNGTEYFLEYVDERGKLLGFLRLRIAEDAAIVRELHVYGQATEIGEKKEQNIQHHHLGRNLLLKAEQITKEKNIRSLSVIAGIGVREYYRKFGYEEKNTYMIKSL